MPNHKINIEEEIITILRSIKLLAIRYLSSLDDEYLALSEGQFDKLFEIENRKKRFRKELSAMESKLSAHCPEARSASDVIAMIPRGSGSRGMAEGLLAEINEILEDISKAQKENIEMINRFRKTSAPVQDGISASSSASFNSTEKKLS